MKMPAYRTLAAEFSILVLIASILGAALAASPAGAQFGPRMTVSPDVGLVDQQKVTVDGDGWSANTALNVVQCQPYLAGPDDCDNANTSVSVMTDGNGSFSTPFPVSEFIDPPNAPGTDCGAAEGCTIVVANASQVDGTGIFFGPTGTISGTVLGDGATVNGNYLAATCPDMTTVIHFCPGFRVAGVDGEGNFTRPFRPGTWAIQGAELGPTFLPVQATPSVVVEVAEGDEWTCEFTLDTNKSASCTNASGAVAEWADPGGTVSTDDAEVTTPNEGTVTIETAPTTGPPPEGFVLVGNEYAIIVPDATAADPLRLVFRVATDEPVESIAVFKDGAEVAGCTDTESSAAAPDPCVLSRVRDGDVVNVTVLSSTASAWTFAVPAANTPPNKAACKKGGWQDYTDHLGTPFKNQGDCVSYVATGGTNLADG